MGQKHRRNRAKIKAEARRLGYKETELGELKAPLSKARRRLDYLWLHGLVIPVAQHQIMRVAEKRALDDIMATEDASVLINLTLLGIKDPPAIVVHDSERCRPPGKSVHFGQPWITAPLLNLLDTCPPGPVQDKIVEATAYYLLATTPVPTPET